MYLTRSKKKFLKKIIYTLFFIFLVLSCNNDENEIIPPRKESDQVIQDMNNIETFLSTHFYNYEEFQNNDIIPELVFDTISGENSDKIPLINQVLKQTANYTTNEGETIEHPIYTLIANEGIGNSPTKADSIYLSYEGILLDKTLFDRSFAPIWFDLTTVVQGFREGMPNLRPGEFYVDSNNVTTFENYGYGAIFMPSRLAYYNNASGLIPEYSPLIFKIKMFLVKETDHDGDGIPSGEEYDNDGDGLPDDNDEDGRPDYLDNDDL